ncbi:response regulator [Pedobacter paludis]|uniref:Response regulator n=1 Tax=Pedobacter paludis TaxID=2203212 RepID=A0A317F3V7_9SPHI|nr:response regulator [Pedobacter paludis]PWS33824.1 response regulator [Pedobacter paludis]
MQDTILIIEDDESILEAIQMILEAEGYHVMSSNSGEILQQFVDEFPNLLIIDEYLPFERGSEICKRIKLQEETANTPVLLLSGHAKIAEIAQKCGADGYIEKPFNLLSFIEIIDQHLKVSQ